MLTVRRGQGLCVLSFPRATSVDAENAREFVDEALRLAGEARACVLDLGKLDFIDSAGLRGLIELRRRLQDRGASLALARPRDDVREILEVTRLSKVFPVYPDVSSATKALREEHFSQQEGASCWPNVRVLRARNGYLVRVQGCDAIDRSSALGLLRTVARLVGKKLPVVIDLTEVEYVDSQALLYLREARKKAAQVGSELRLVARPSLVELILAQAPDLQSSVAASEIPAQEDAVHEGESEAEARAERREGPEVRYVDLSLLAGEPQPRST